MSGEAKAAGAPTNALHWRVDVTDEQGRSFTMGAFLVEGDAEEYAARLDADAKHEWSVTVEEIDQ